MQLKVISAKREDVFGDRIRVNEAYRRDENGKLVRAGAVCRVSTRSGSVLAVARGLSSSDGAVIRMDEALRNKLQLNHGETEEFQIKEANLIEQVQWGWSATDPGYRLATRLAVLSVALGAIGFGLGVWSICLSLFASSA